MRYRNLSETLVELRKSRKMTQQELGNELGVTNKTISKWENGVFLPDITYLVAIADLYLISVDDLLRGTVLLHNTDNTLKNTPKEKKRRHNRRVGTIIISILLVIDIFLIVFNTLNSNVDKTYRYTNIIALSIAGAILLFVEIKRIAKAIDEAKRDKLKSSSKKTIKM